MDKRVVLKLGDSTLGQGFPVTLAIGNEGESLVLSASGRLPADPELYQLYATWATAYRQLGVQRQIQEENNLLEGDRPQPHTDWNASDWSAIDLESCRNAARSLSDRLNRWLQTEGFRPIQQVLLSELAVDDSIYLLLETDNVWLRRLPWHVWDLYSRFPNLEIGLSTRGNQSPPRPPVQRPVVHILSVLSGLQKLNGGHSILPAELPEALGEGVPDADVTLLVEPQLAALIHTLESQEWDILFFSGQSPNAETAEAGRVYLNSTDSVEMTDFGLMLETAAYRGLQIGVFNSWDGMAIARVLDTLNIPQVVMMREPTPNAIAHIFFQAFLLEFSGGLPFHLAVRRAREALHELDAEFPCGAWLPVICQHPAAPVCRWLNWGDRALTSAALSPSAASPPPTYMESGVATGGTAGPPGGETLTTGSNLIHNRYQIQKVLGRGGFGQTYLAIDTHRFNEPCVLKQFIPTSRSESSLQKARELFQREAKVLYQINHPQIPKFLAWFTHQDDLFIVQEYIDGQSYLSLLRDRQKRGQTFSQQEVVRWLKDLLPVLDYIHSISIVHRDISPANVMFSREKGKPMLIDFGVVKEVVNQILSGQYSTFAYPPKATLVGKPGYSPPEQIQLGDCYPCSDIYALGMTAVVLLTGQDARASRNQWLNYPEITPPLSEVLERMLAERPRDRYQTAQEILTDLNRRVLPQLQPPPPPPRQSPNPSPRQPEGPPYPTQETDIDENPFAAWTGEVAANPDSLAGFANPVASEELTPAFIDYCERSLAQYIGPVASFAIDELLAQSPHLDCGEFVARLATEIPSTDEAQAFQASIQAFSDRRQPPPGTAPSLSGRPELLIHHSEPPEPQPAPPTPTLSVDFIERCRYELARCIGPMANFIMDDVLDGVRPLNEHQLIEAIAREIPSASTADEFRQRFQV